MLQIIHWFTIFYVILLTLLLELPIDPPENLDPMIEPIVRHAHLIAFALLGFLVELGRCKKAVLFWGIMLILYAVGTEVLQWILHPICYRWFDLYDILNNVVGLFFGTLVGYFCQPLVKRPSETLDKKE